MNKSQHRGDGYESSLKEGRTTFDGSFNKRESFGVFCLSTFQFISKSARMSQCL
jgi:hypothetical protein